MDICFPLNKCTIHSQVRFKHLTPNGARIILPSFNSIKYDLNEDMQTETEENIKFQFYQVRFKHPNAPFFLQFGASFNSIKYDLNEKVAELPIEDKEVSILSSTI